MSTGRPPSTSQDQIADAALTLFAARGFEETTVEEIAAAVGVGRRTIFRYFRSKNDMVWGDFDQVMRRLRMHLEEAGPETGLMEALRRAVVLSNRYPPEQLDGLRIRMTLITTVPALQGHSMLRYAAWRSVIVEYAAGRLGEPADGLGPQALAHAALGTAMSTFSLWAADPRIDLEEALDRAFELLAAGFAEGERRVR
jgi:mycofactocin system transcriptional regulator